eukprot:Selendium_serpulae@DN5332_c0_g1_i8.p1
MLLSAIVGDDKRIQCLNINASSRQEIVRRTESYCAFSLSLLRSPLSVAWNPLLIVETERFDLHAEQLMVCSLVRGSRSKDVSGDLHIRHLTYSLMSHVLCVD